MYHWIHTTQIYSIIWFCNILPSKNTYGKEWYRDSKKEKEDFLVHKGRNIEKLYHKKRKNPNKTRICKKIIPSYNARTFIDFYLSPKKDRMFLFYLHHLCLRFSLSMPCLSSSLLCSKQRGLVFPLSRAPTTLANLNVVDLRKSFTKRQLHW